MPFYRCIIPKDSLDYGERHKIAKAFTDVHCGISAAPRSFVQVQFIETTEKVDIFNSHGQGALSYSTPYFIAGGNRAGRPPEVKQQILEGLMAIFCEIANVAPGDISGHISEAPASWTMEGGEILPEPGEEPAEWYQHESVPG